MNLALSDWKPKSILQNSILRTKIPIAFIKKSTNMTLDQNESIVPNSISSWDQIMDGKQSSGELLSQEQKLKVFWLFVLARNSFKA